MVADAATVPVHASVRPKTSRRRKIDSEVGLKKCWRKGLKWGFFLSCIITYNLSDFLEIEKCNFTQRKQALRKRLFDVICCRRDAILTHGYKEKEKSFHRLSFPTSPYPAARIHSLTHKKCIHSKCSILNVFIGHSPSPCSTWSRTWTPSLPAPSAPLTTSSSSPRCQCCPERSTSKISAPLLLRPEMKFVLFNIFTLPFAMKNAFSRLSFSGMSDI